jgi:hypothetical protein
LTGSELGTTGRGGVDAGWEATSEEGNDAAVVLCYAGLCWLLACGIHPARHGVRARVVGGCPALLAKHSPLRMGSLTISCSKLPAGEREAPAFFRGAKSPPHGFSFLFPRSLSTRSLLPPCPSLGTPRGQGSISQASRAC